MATTMKYSLKDINDISNSGFKFEIPKDVLDTINYLCIQVNSNVISNNVFSRTIEEDDNKYKKKKGNKAMEVSSEEWETIRTFQTTKIEQKQGLDSDIDEIRLYLNKLTDKTFLDMRTKIIDKIDKMIMTMTDDDKTRVGQLLYDISSTTKFYSKVFGDLFAELGTKYGWIKKVFDEKKTKLMAIYENIKYVDSEVDYDGFCEMNKNNEKRRAITTFYMNLALNGFIEKSFVVNILKEILTSIMNMIKLPDKKNEVDELTEIVAILFNKEMIDDVDDDADDPEDYYVLDESIINTINNLAQKKVKDYPSLSNKAIFKYMDLIEM